MTTPHAYAPGRRARCRKCRSIFKVGDTTAMKDARCVFCDAKLNTEYRGNLPLTIPTGQDTVSPRYPTTPPRLFGPDPVPGVVFVFGSNLAGRHGKGAALSAREFYGAKVGNQHSHGRVGNSYAIPTKTESMRPVSIFALTGYIAQFFGYAEAAHDWGYPDWYLVTRVGCGLAGFEDEDVALMFAGCSPNVILPRVWESILLEAAYKKGARRDRQPGWFKGRLWHDREPNEDTSYIVKIDNGVTCRHCGAVDRAASHLGLYDFAMFVDAFAARHTCCPDQQRALPVA